MRPRDRVWRQRLLPSSHPTHGRHDTTGRLALAVGDYLRPQLPQVLVLVREDMNNKNRRLYCREALECVASLVIAVADDMSPHIEELVDSMFAGGLNETLINTLTVIRYVCCVGWTNRWVHACLLTFWLAVEAIP